MYPYNYVYSTERYKSHVACLAALAEEEHRALLTDAAMASVQRLSATVPEPRKRRGLRYDLPFLLTCLVAALLSTCTSRSAVGQ